MHGILFSFCTQTLHHIDEETDIVYTVSAGVGPVSSRYEHLISEYHVRTFTCDFLVSLSF